MKAALLSLVLLAIAFGSAQDSGDKTKGASSSDAGARLDIERGFVAVPDAWYQDKFGLVAESATEQREGLDLAVRRDGADALLVDVGSRMQSGVRLTLRFRYEGERIAECTAMGRWRYDHVTVGSPRAGDVRDISGFVRLYSREGERRKFACLFAVHGSASRSPKPDDVPDLLMGGFEIDDPFGESSAGK